ncbi:hypothetical protein MLD63_02400 (plasmid) [Paracoccus sp. TK19116]|uniref:Uncharacterized protein n=1 Tax=Paracoccus albicereus TaxID=2922394 RepID=A0ABT1MPF1_9RHOB|nr:hypothetical protein [Paracoccus albicereus]MCQ0969288.1 hypothetical protein [Paracoccus albicereus]
MTRLWALGAVLCAALLQPAAFAGEAGDAVFAERGPWSLDGETPTWSLTIEGPEAPGFIGIKDGSVSIAEVTDPSDGKPVLELTENTDTRERKIGPFPISGGDPVLTFFLEQTARDMARQTGGSPFYIRNRMKDALFQAGEVTREDGTMTATFHPFISETSPERLRGFETLTLRFVMGEDPKQPIRELHAETTPQGDLAPYRNQMVMQ